MKLFILLLLILFPFMSHAESDKGNGGDEVGIEFHNRFHQAFSRLKLVEPVYYQLLKDAGVEYLIDRVEVIVVNYPLSTVSNKATQSSVAINLPVQRQILINRARWNSILNPTMKQAIALHEILSLAGFEGTGLYTYSTLIYAEIDQTTPKIKSIESRQSYLSAPGLIHDPTCELSLLDGVYFFDDEGKLLASAKYTGAQLQTLLNKGYSPRVRNVAMGSDGKLHAPAVPTNVLSLEPRGRLDTQFCSPRILTSFDVTIVLHSPSGELFKGGASDDVGEEAFCDRPVSVSSVFEKLPNCAIK